MHFTLLATIAKWEIALFLSALAAILAFRILTGKINTRYLLYGTRGDGSRYFSPERVQLLIITLAVAIEYLADASQPGNSGKMPDLPYGAVQLLGASNAVFLGGKALAFLRSAPPV